MSIIKKLKINVSSLDCNTYRINSFYCSSYWWTLRLFSSRRNWHIRPFCKSHDCEHCTTYLRCRCPSLAVRNKKGWKRIVSVETGLNPEIMAQSLPSYHWGWRFMVLWLMPDVGTWYLFTARPVFLHFVVNTSLKLLQWEAIKKSDT